MTHHLSLLDAALADLQERIREARQVLHTDPAEAARLVIRLDTQPARAEARAVLREAHGEPRDAVPTLPTESTYATPNPGADLPSVTPTCDDPTCGCHALSQLERASVEQNEGPVAIPMGDTPADEARWRQIRGRTLRTTRQSDAALDALSAVPSSPPDPDEPPHS